MRPTRHLWVFCFCLGMTLVINAAGWLFFTQLTNFVTIDAQASSAWLLPAYGAAMLVLVGLFTYGVSALFGRSHRAFGQALQRLAHTDLPRLSSALSKLSEGDLTVQIEDRITRLHEMQYPGERDLVPVYNEIVREIQQIGQILNNVTDEPCQRLVYVGGDSFREGRVCGELMGQVLHGQGKVAILNIQTNHAHGLRKSGLRATLNEKFPGIQVATEVDCPGQLDTVYPRVKDLLNKIPELAAIYVPHGSAPSLVAQAIVESGKAGKVKLLCHDLVDGTMRAMQAGVVTSTISQDPFAQGHDPVIYLYNYLVCGALPPRPKMITQMEQITIENYQQFWDPQRGAIENEAALERRARPVEQLPQRQIRILILGREDDAFFDPVKRGALQAAEELRSRNTTVEWVEPEAAGRSRQYGAADYGPAIEAAIANKVDAIAVPVFDKALVPYINRAVAAGIPVATYNSEPSSLRNLLNNLIGQSEHLREITVHLAQSAAVSEEHANRINESIGGMSQALYTEVQSALEAIQNTQEIAQAMNDINAGAKEQSSAVSSVSAAIDQISSAVSTTNETALVSEETADQAVATAQQGALVIKQTLGQIQAISEAVKAAVAQIYELNRISKQVDTIVNTVKDFAEQTNMLALNAAIEAAYAGQYGAGFAVVGSEIRTLAKKSKESTKEIAVLINEVQRSAQQMVKTVDDAMAQAQSGSILAAQAGQALDELLKSAETMKGQTEKVVQANASLVDTLDQLTEANHRVSAVVEQNVSATEQVTNTIQRTVGVINHMTGISKENSTAIEGIHASTDDVAGRAQQLKETILSLVNMAEELQGSAATFKINEQ